MRKNIVCAGDMKDADILIKISPKAKAAIARDMKNIPFVFFVLANISKASNKPTTFNLSRLFKNQVNQAPFYLFSIDKSQ